MTLDEIRQLIEKAGPPDPSGREVGKGLLANSGGDTKRYGLYLGWDPAIAAQCDQTWGAFNTRLLEHVRSLELDDEATEEILNGLQLEDAHWDWLAKAVHHRADEYKWFFLVAEGSPQGACLIYHPKPSAIDEQGIYYIEYLAVAPWNRKNPLEARVFKRVGSEMLRWVCAYAASELGLRPGFCLHALPKAIGFYQAIGMVPFPDLDKERLPYYEMPEDRCPMPSTV